MNKYRFCGVSQMGKSHETSETVNQDAYYFLDKTEYIIAAVADGLGSSKRSDIASKIAVKGAVEHCAGLISTKTQDKDILKIITDAFDKVNFEIKQTAGEHLDDYDTTLTLAVFMHHSVFFGHVGDSGVIALRCDGKFEEVTVPQLGSGYGKERPVFPLASKSHWVFGKYKHKTKAIFLMTDGMLNKVIPPMLDKQVYKLDHEYLFYIYDNLCKNANLDKWIVDEMTLILPPEVNYDDKTIVAIVFIKSRIKLQTKKYYLFPGKDLWSSLLEQQKRQLYSYRYQDKKDTPTDKRVDGNGQTLLSSIINRAGEKKKLLMLLIPAILLATIIVFTFLVLLLVK